MFCKSCSSTIDPKWKFAIENNVCPFCGTIIMAEELKNLFKEVGDIMNVLMTSYEPETLEWFLVNYNLISTSSPKLKEFLSDTDKKDMVVELVKSSPKELLKDENDLVISKASDKETAGFFERAGAVKSGGEGIAEKGQRLKSLAAKIKQEGIKTSEFEDLLEDDGGEDLPLEDESVPDYLLQSAAGSNKEAKDLLLLKRSQAKARRTQNGDMSGGSFSRG